VPYENAPKRASITAGVFKKKICKFWGEKIARTTG
jgi:hypothetical protein